MIGAKVKTGNVRRTISIPTTIDERARKLYKQQGDFSKVVIEALDKYLKEKGI